MQVLMLHLNPGWDVESEHGRAKGRALLSPREQNPSITKRQLTKAYAIFHMHRSS